MPAEYDVVLIKFSFPRKSFKIRFLEVMACIQQAAEKAFEYWW